MRYINKPALVFDRLISPVALSKCDAPPKRKGRKRGNQGSRVRLPHRVHGKPLSFFACIGTMNPIVLVLVLVLVLETKLAGRGRVRERGRGRRDGSWKGRIAEDSP